MGGIMIRICTNCNGEELIKAGRLPSGAQRYQCTECNSYKIKEVEDGYKLIIPDIHLPFEHPKALEFIESVQSRYNISSDNIYSAGDMIDNNTLNFHEKDPDGISAVEEMARVREKLVPWFKAFPKMKIASGNHDRLLIRKAKAAGLPSAYIKDILEVMGAPEG